MADTDVNLTKLVNGHALQLFAQGVAAKYATQAQLNAAVQGFKFKGNVDNLAALKALKAPKEGDAYTVTEGANKVYMFDADNAATEDSADGKIVVVTDKTAGAFVLIAQLVFSAATADADGLLTAALFTKLNALPDAAGLTASFNGKVDKVDGKGLSANDFTDAYKGKIDALHPYAQTFYAKVNVGSDTDVEVSDLVASVEGAVPQVNDVVIDINGDLYNVTAYTPASGEGEQAVTAKIHVSQNIAEIALATDADVTAKIAALANVYVAKDGYIAFTQAEKDKLAGITIADYLKKADAESTYLKKADYHAYTLPVATADVLGGVKIGTGIAVSDEGVISTTPVDLSAYSTTEQMNTAIDTKVAAEATARDEAIAAKVANEATARDAAITAATQVVSDDFVNGLFA